MIISSVEVAQAAALAPPDLHAAPCVELAPEGRSLFIVAGGGRELAWSSGQIASQLLARTGGRSVQLLLHGGARGADQAIDQAAQQLGWPVLSLPADWQRFGRAAGPIRNRLLLEQALGKAEALNSPDQLVSVLVMAFPGGAGTASLVQQARRLALVSAVPIAVSQISGQIAASLPNF